MVSIDIRPKYVLILNALIWDLTVQTKNIVSVTSHFLFSDEFKLCKLYKNEYFYTSNMILIASNFLLVFIKFITTQRYEPFVFVPMSDI